ncbi:MAG: 50S ribosomal protein L6 [Deltaproteobacteria bacterium HGW-Deltaproteobacteria-21]|jgi:large subunit ribosomal protein L6|nr:MAG: 50S ribosomal protein L6 [Deltaproteobacteria bacterium HGW-Deltaproteobacteria-21]PKN67478.1 MAG: 50S ribosomal protein L6 [Deltaproteobacteria bacterium HGW-Deltaproteobacteria-15]
MSRIGKKPVPLPDKVKIEMNDLLLTVSGPKGKLQKKLHPGVKVTSDDKSAVVTIDETLKGANALHGLHRALLANMVTGVSKGFERALEIVGVGYRAELSGRAVTLHLGYSHPVVFPLPEGVDGKVEKTKVTLSSIDKELLGRTAAKIRGFREPEPYKGKGIKYAEEIIRRKAGKSGAK